jgi:hypothetical protein
MLAAVFDRASEVPVFAVVIGCVRIRMSFRLLSRRFA